MDARETPFMVQRSPIVGRCLVASKECRSECSEINAAFTVVDFIFSNLAVLLKIPHSVDFFPSSGLYTGSFRPLGSICHILA